MNCSYHRRPVSWPVVVARAWSHATAETRAPKSKSKRGRVEGTGRSTTYIITNRSMSIESVGVYRYRYVCIYIYVHGYASVRTGMYRCT